MEGNDLGSHWSQKYVVIAEPAIFIPPADQYKISVFGRHLGKREVTAAEYEINRNMVQWIANVGRYRNMPTEIWTFITDEDLVDKLAERIDRIAGNAIVGWQVWEDPQDAVLDLKVDSAIHTVYDADPHRCERLWGMRGHRVPRGGTPSS